MHLSALQADLPGGTELTVHCIITVLVAQVGDKKKYLRIKNNSQGPIIQL